MVLHSLTVTLRRLADPAAALTPDVLESLSNFPEEEAGAFLTAWSRLDEERKIAVLQALAALAEEEYRLDFNTVYRLALEDESPRVRAEAVRVSVDDETEPMLERLLALMRTEVDAAVRERVAVALGRFALRGALGDLPPDRVDEIRQVLLGAFANASEPLAVRQAALGSVGYLDDETVRRAVEQAVEQPSFHVSALRAMGRSADARWLPRVVADLRHPDPAVRAEAARACAASPWTRCSWDTPKRNSHTRSTYSRSHRRLHPQGSTRPSDSVRRTLHKPSTSLSPPSQRSLRTPALRCSPPFLPSLEIHSNIRSNCTRKRPDRSNSPHCASAQPSRTGI